MNTQHTEERSTRPKVVQARALDTRVKIIDAAERAFARHGYDAASLTRDILAPAGVSVGSFYHQFENKAELMQALLHERLTARHERVLAAVPDTRVSFSSDLQAAVGAMVDSIDDNPLIWEIQFRERQHPDAAIHATLNSRWRLWFGVARDVCSHYFEGDDGSIEHVARSTVQVISGFLLDYLVADPDERTVLRSRLVLTCDFCNAGALAFTTARMNV